MKIIRISEVTNENRKGYSIKRLFTECLSKNPKNVGFYETTIPKGSKCSEHYHSNLDEIIYFITKGKMRFGEKRISGSQEENMCPEESQTASNFKICLLHVEILFFEVSLV